jgi:hypothetical protein
VRARTEIATRILLRELQVLEKERYHERRVPKRKPECRDTARDSNCAAAKK